MFKKRNNLLIAAVVGLLVLAFAVVPAFAASSTTTSVNPLITTAGRAGIDLIGTSKVSLVHESFVKGMGAKAISGVRIVGRMVDFTLVNAKNLGNQRAYIFFNVKPKMASALNAGKVAIYELNTKTHTWTKLPTFSVKGDRISAIAPRTGIYALGRAK